MNRSHFFALSLIFPAALSAGVIFSEDFESYADGSILGGQNGWTDVTQQGSGRMRVGDGSHLPSRVLDGRDATTCCGLNFAAKNLDRPVNSGAITVLSFDGWAVSAGVQTSNFGTYFSRSGQPAAFAVGWFAVRDRGWDFDARFITSNTKNVWTIPLPKANTYDVPGRFQVIVDGLAGQVYGSYDFGPGRSGLTPKFAVTPTQIEQYVQAISIHVDFRGSLGGEFDNILVIEQAKVPEPGSAFLVSLVLVATLSRSLRKAPTKQNGEI